MTSVHFPWKPFNSTVIQSVPQTLMPKSWSWLVLRRPTRLSRINSKKDILFITGDRNAKVASQEIPWVTGKFDLEVQNGFSSSYVWMWELDNKEGWAMKNWSFKSWCWRRFLNFPWTAMKSNGNNPEYSLEGLRLKVNLQYFGHLM